MRRPRLRAVQAAGPPTLGLWCSFCLTPGRWEAGVYALSALGVERIARRGGCSTCDRRP